MKQSAWRRVTPWGPSPPSECVVEGSVANRDNVRLVPVGWLLEPAGTLAPGRWGEVGAAMTHAIADG